MSYGQSFRLFVVVALSSASAACGGDEGGGGGGNTGGASSIDACSIVTQADATQLFGETAEKFVGSGPGTPDPALRGECSWDYDYPDGSSHLLQFHIWDKDYYFEPTGAEAFALGEDGYVLTATKSVDLGWVQGELSADLSYSTNGPSAPDAAPKKEEVKTLATAAAGKLPK